MPAINKYEVTHHPEPGAQTYRKTLYSQNGIDNGIWKGKVSSTYAMRKCFTTSIGRYSNGSACAWHTDSQFGYYGLLGTSDPRYVPSDNQAYARFLEASTDSQSQVGTAIAEWRQTVNLVTDGALTLRDAWMGFKDTAAGKLKRSVRLNPRNGTCRVLDEPRRVAERAADAWLTWWFGVAPTIGDITTSLEQASEPLPDGENYQGYAKCLIDSRGGSATAFVNTGLYEVWTGARVLLTNPNLYLASQLGLVNPAAVAFEIIPFSFLADWAFDVSSFISSFTDFVGCSVTMPYTSRKNSGFVSVTGNWFSGRWVSHQLQFLRETKLVRPRPNFQVQANLGTSLTRAASATALLIQAFR